MTSQKKDEISDFLVIISDSNLYYFVSSSYFGFGFKLVRPNKQKNAKLPDFLIYEWGACTYFTTDIYLLNNTWRHRRLWKICVSFATSLYDSFRDYWLDRRTYVLTVPYLYVSLLPSPIFCHINVFSRYNTNYLNEFMYLLPTSQRFLYFNSVIFTRYARVVRLDTVCRGWFACRITIIIIFCCNYAEL